jgi:predicted nucleotidyltransferase
MSLPARVNAFVPGKVIAANCMRPDRDRVSSYVEAVADAGARLGCRLVSVILFGSAATGGFSETVSDLDLILVVHDGVTRDQRRQLTEEVERLEVLHGFRVPRVRAQNRLERVLDRLTATVRSFFMCARQDLLSGRVDRILDLRPAQGLFVDRVVLPSIVGSAVTVWGQDLLPQVPLLPIRRFDVLKAFHGLFGQMVLIVTFYPMMPNATKYAMAALKRSVHNCFFCYQAHSAVLEQEVSFLQHRIGPSMTLQQLLDLRQEHTHSFGFVVRCLPLLIRLHWRTAWDNPFPAPHW